MRSEQDARNYSRSHLQLLRVRACQHWRFSLILDICMAVAAQTHSTEGINSYLHWWSLTLVEIQGNCTGIHGTFIGDNTSAFPRVQLYNGTNPQPWQCFCFPELKMSLQLPLTLTNWKKQTISKPAGNSKAKSSSIWISSHNTLSSAAPGKQST